MARRDDNAGACIQMSDCERKLRRGPRSVENTGVASIFRSHLRSELSEFFGKKSRVMRDHDFRFFAGKSLRVPLVQISDEPARGATDVEKIHRVRADAGKLRPPCSRIATLCRGHNFSDRAAA